MGNNCSVWFQAVIRGDVNSIRIGNKVNIQDGVVVHGSYLDVPTALGNNVSIGHRAILHGCTLQSNVLVGMGAIVLDGVVVEENCIIAAGAVVLENSHLESGYIYAGIPARKVKALDMKTSDNMIERIAGKYCSYIDWYK